MIPPGATKAINLSRASSKERVGLNRGATRTLRLWGFECSATTRGVRRALGESGSKYFLPGLNGTTASPRGIENISNKIVLCPVFSRFFQGFSAVRFNVWQSGVVSRADDGIVSQRVFHFLAPAR